MERQLTIWFPITLHRVIKESVPKIDPFTELGRRRNTIDLDNEYHRLLARDLNPFAFLYIRMTCTHFIPCIVILTSSIEFRREWGTFQSTYLFAKLSTLVIIAIIDPNNCLCRSLSRSLVPIVRQVLLLIATIGFFAIQCFFAPFIDPVNNASEWISRLNYIATATVALLVVLNIPGKDILNDYMLYMCVV